MDFSSDGGRESTIVIDRDEDPVDDDPGAEITDPFEEVLDALSDCVEGGPVVDFLAPIRTE